MTNQAEATGDYTAELREIAASLTAGDLGILLGAGMSHGQVDLAAIMAKRMLRRALLGNGQEDNDSHDVIDREAERYPFEAIAALLREKHPYNSLEKWLAKEGKLAAAKPGDAHRQLHELHNLVPHCFPRLLFTTNFDTLIEDEFADDARSITSKNLVDLIDARKERQIAIAHLHGSYKVPDSIVAGEGELAATEGCMFDLLRGALSTDIFVLVGYSLTDINIRRVFFDLQRIADTRHGLKKRTFAVSPAEGNPGDSTTAAGIARVLWRQRGVDHIAMSAAEFLRSLCLATTDFITVQVRQEVAVALGRDVATLDSLLESAIEPFGVLRPTDLLIYLYYTLSPHERRP